MRIIAPNKNLFLPRRARLGGFTLLELVAVVAIITVLVSLLCAALNHTKARVLRITCLDNMKQLQLGWAMYETENDGWLPHNKTAPAPNKPTIFGRKLSEKSWVVGNPQLDLTDENIRRGSLYPYILSPDIYRCPMDSATVYGHPDVPRNRSYSMSAYLGGDNTGADSRVKMRINEITRPENVFVFIEEHEESLWAANFLVQPLPRLSAASASSARSTTSTPSDRHYQGCNLTFADGHVEYWRWYSPKRSSDQKLSSTLRDLSDMRRLQNAVPQP